MRVFTFLLVLVAWSQFAQAHPANPFQKKRETQNVDCVVSEWSGWSPCNGHCFSNEETPVMTRYRWVLTEPTGNGQKCPHLEESQPCNDWFPCPTCNSVACNFTGTFRLGTSSWCMCCAAGPGTNCTDSKDWYKTNKYRFDDCIAQGWGTTLCRGYPRPSWLVPNSGRPCIPNVPPTV